MGVQIERVGGIASKNDPTSSTNQAYTFDDSGAVLVGTGGNVMGSFRLSSVVAATTLTVYGCHSPYDGAEALVDYAGNSVVVPCVPNQVCELPPAVFSCPFITLVTDAGTVTASFFFRP